MSGEVSVRAAEVPFPPEVEDFYPPSLIDGAGPWLTKITLLVGLSIVLIVFFFLFAYRKPKLVPGRMQWLAEAIYEFVRNRIAGDIIGPGGVRFAPYLATLFCFVLLNNLFGIIPGIQFSPMAHLAFPAALAVVSWVMFIYVGARKFGLAGYLKKSLVLPAPLFIQPLLIPIEFISTFLVRPFTLSVRLFANMFAGHMVLLVCALGGFVLLNAELVFLRPTSLVSWAVGIALTGLELLVAVLQAYIFTLLTASYVQGALAEGH
ncbi:MAG: F0F1 ATP synthase subunit A [Micromonosporaceae bacterium]|nr:F0F1 ATP synthase subunit A [Micromonosporaceae bacterium]